MNNNNIESTRPQMNMPLPYPETDEEEDEELSESYNINEEVLDYNNEGGQGSDCSSSSGRGASSSNKSAISSASSSSSSSNLSLDGDETDEDDEQIDDEDDDDDDSTIQSDEFELAHLSSEHTFRLPRGLCENASIFNEFFSLETWKMLPQGMQTQLQALLPNFATLLPPAQAAAEQQRTVTQLFNGGVQRFGQSPLQRLQQQLEEGNLRPDMVQLRNSIEQSKRRERRFQQGERLSQLAKELFLSREQLLRKAYTMPPESALPRGSRKRKPPTLHMDNKFLATRARKRYCMELYELRKELQLDSCLSADEEREDADAITRTERNAIEQDWAPTMPMAEATTKTNAAADKKCIYNTFFKRRHGVEDEHVLRNMQAAKIPKLNDKNFKKYLRDYKRRKLAEPQLPDFDTTDIRLRDICTRAQFVGSFKPGRKPKALMQRLNEPPALVPIGAKNEATATVAAAAAAPTPLPELLLTDEPQQLFGRAALDYGDDIDEGLDLEGIAFDSGKMKTHKLLPAGKPLPKLEPIGLQRNAQQQQQQLARAKSQINAKTLLKTTSTHITGSPTRELPTAANEATHCIQANCYFALLRDFFVGTPNHRMTYTELQTLVTAWRDNIALNAGATTPLEWHRMQPDWTLLLQSAINFLAGDFTSLPLEYVPYIEHKMQLNIYQWIGAGRDSDARLLTLCNYWQQRRKELKEHTPTHSPRAKALSNATSAVELGVGVKLLVDQISLNSPTPPPRFPTSWTVRTATASERLEFQRQERLRFEQPHRPYTYRMHGYESVVGPVKGIYTQAFSLNKARGHTVMVDERPTYVTILTLVRDATARLPNGEGTRAEISELLKCSQFINQNAAENVLQTIVSGALDRLHGGQDPCVRYDAKRKIWIYLHRNRSEQEFERMHKHNQTLVKQKQQQRKGKPKKEDGMADDQQVGETNELPALVPAASGATVAATGATAATATTATATLLLKKSIPTMPPVPPLKYNIPASSMQQQHQQQQKSLLKSPLHLAQRSGVVTIVEKPNAKQYGFPMPTGAAAALPTATGATAKISPTRNTTPILVSTPSGLQTVHVATSPPVGVATKKLAIKKPIIISPAAAAKPQQQQTQLKSIQPQLGSFILPLEQQQSPKQQLTDATKNVLAISPRQQMPKNIIRLMPSSSSITTTTTTTATVAMPKQSNTVQIMGPRVLAQTTVRPLQQQQKIGSVSIVSNKQATATATPTGTIVKMSPQAFATLQQKQLLNKTSAATGQPHQQHQQQRILVGNTAISSNKNIVFQAVPATAAVQSKAGSSAAKTNLSPQQQRIVLQNFKQQTVQFKALPTEQQSKQQTTSPATTVTTPTRVLRAAPQTGQIITLDNLLQKQTPGGGAKVLATNIFQLATSSSNASQLVSPPRNVITLAPNAQQQPQQQQRLLTTAAGTKLTGARFVSTNVPKIIGKTTVLPGATAKPLLLQAKTLNATAAAAGGSAGITLKNVSSAAASTTTATLRAACAQTQTLQNLVIGGQTLKLQSAPRQPTSVANSSGMQTVIMGNQLLRLQHVSTANSVSSNTPASSTNSNSSPNASIASAPKTLVIGTGGQTLRLQSNALGKNVIVATGNKMVANANATSNANNLVFAVQGGGGQLYFSPALQGVNLKPLSNMKVIPMANAKAAQLNVATATNADGSKTTFAKVLKTPSGNVAGSGP